MDKERISLSYPDIQTADIKSIQDMLLSLSTKDSNANHAFNKFEEQLAEFHGVAHAVVLSSGTAAIHLALRLLGIGKGDKVVIPTLTFAATAFPVLYESSVPIFVDVDSQTWTLNLDLLEEYLHNSKKRNLPKLIVSVDLFGRMCDYDRLINIAQNFEIPLLIDAAESVGSKYKGFHPANKGKITILSFNFNKILTTLGGGALLTNDESISLAARKLSNQARENYHWYEHREIGFNYRMNLLQATLGLSQLSRINLLVEERRAVREIYSEIFQDDRRIQVLKDMPWETSNAWLSTVKFDSYLVPKIRDKVFDALTSENIESRFVWKPLHRQPVFHKFERFLDGTADRVFDDSLCLPSSNFLTRPQIENISEIIKGVLN